MESESPLFHQGSSATLASSPLDSVFSFRVPSCLFPQQQQLHLKHDFIEIKGFQNESPQQRLKSSSLHCNLGLMAIFPT